MKILRCIKILRCCSRESAGYDSILNRKIHIPISCEQTFHWAKFFSCNSKCVGDEEESFSSKNGWNKRLQPKSAIGFQGVTFSKGQPFDGVAEGPSFIRQSGIIKLLREELGQDVVDFGDIPIPQSALHNHRSRKKTNTEKKMEKEKKENEKSQKDKRPKVAPDSHAEKRQREKLREIVKTKSKSIVYSDDESGHIYNKALLNTVEVAQTGKIISEATSNIMNDGRICVTLGGDHSISIGTINGVANVINDLGLLWIDAHTDLHTFHSTETGHYHGMAAAFCILEMQTYMAKVPGFEWVIPRIKAENVAFVATRCVDPLERAYMDTIGIRTYDIADIHHSGVKNVIRRALERISPDQKRAVHVSFDIDALDSLEIISTGTPVAGGLTLREAIAIAEEIHKHGIMLSMDFVELNPEIGTPYEAKRAAECASKILYAILGGCRRGVADPDQQIPYICKRP